MSRFSIPAALLWLAALVSPTHAETFELGVANVRIVSIRDLDLTNARDVALLDRKIITAVKQVCPPADRMNLSRTRIAHQCWSDTLARTQAKRDAAIAAAQTSRATRVASITVR